MSKMLASGSERIAPLWTVKDVSEFLRVPVTTLYAWRVQGSGPPARKIGKYLRYRADEVESWVNNLEKDGD